MEIGKRRFYIIKASFMEIFIHSLKLYTMVKPGQKIDISIDFIQKKKSKGNIESNRKSKQIETCNRIVKSNRNAESNRNFQSHQSNRIETSNRMQSKLESNPN